MAKRRESDPSPLRSGLLHAGLSLLVFGGATGLIGAGIHFTGNPAEASPRQVIALFDADGQAPSPAIKRYIRDGQTVQAAAVEEPTLDYANLDYENSDSPSLGVADPGAPQVAQGAAAAQPAGIRINGKTVLPGQSLSQVQQASQAVAKQADKPVPAAVSSKGLTERKTAGKLPVKSSDGRSVARVYAKPFSNPEGKPTASLIIGGLGTSRGAVYTRAAIDELPPEITLSFVAHAQNLNGLVKRARDNGHEVLIEAPMESYGDGRSRPSARQIRTGLTAEANIANLEWVLARTHGYFGVMNYEGAKFATERASAAPVMDALARRGVAFIETGNLTRSVLGEEASKAGGLFARSMTVIDARTDGNAIKSELVELERAALENGKALGTGFAYPVTIDTVKAWAERLETKGIVLAPASHMLQQPGRGPIKAASAPRTAASSDGAF